MAGKLYGLGIGPGDPQLLTLKAKNILEKTPVVFVPKSHDDRESRAESVIAGFLRPQTEVRELLFPMSRDRRVLNHFWKEAAGEIASVLEETKEAVFVTLGDPLTYSTYIYLLYMLSQDHPQVELETVPGVTSYCTAAACGNMPMVEGSECFAVIPVVQNSMERLKSILKSFETTILMKIGIRLPLVIDLLKDLKLLQNSILVSHAGYAQQLVEKDLSVIKENNKGYLSVIIVKNLKARKK